MPAAASKKKITPALAPDPREEEEKITTEDTENTEKRTASAADAIQKS